ncbi:MAG: bifunctional glutamate N-acetyltransferase/amino-acid acetyltransferase ArgJ [Gammaproteobacteria bacterium]|nr:bifunctional glutamate N-acetyltransferase/amino-acid acetyltransferase ArgJ [Gammaproteobacteria bacterium]MCW8986313.1 bifunctional glutamate N-acetyltransferase/amino-acid acetyltransferase ArgJ [Gammaproteobacteria bacterium]MCW9031309.1 bifunctional glutamate N-acetyltransferase/amino-acid acetyltransferase ArgJ [Gammaproteobacteria bacterium]
MTQERNIDFKKFPVAGIRLGVACAGIKKGKSTSDRSDLVLIEIAENSHTVAVFTQNAFCAAPVVISKKHLTLSSPRYLLVNTGNANAGTGEQGIDDAISCCDMVANVASVKTSEVLPFSTGVIGEYLPVSKFQKAINSAYENLSEDNWESAAKGILTTDTVVKAFTRSLNINNQTITISGIAKGSGMIRPDMATMLAYIATDAKLGQGLLQNCLLDAVNHSFNRITVDGDTSTNDSAILIATGQSGLELAKDSAELSAFQGALTEICEELAKDIVRDGEGATKLISIAVSGCKDDKEAKDVAFTVAHSPLVKTAFFASDPNWGRILAAVGRAGVTDFDLSKVNIALDDVYIVRDGGKASDYSEERGQKVMDKSDITIHIDLGRGDKEIMVWTCDFSYDYVRINAEYRT